MPNVNDLAYQARLSSQKLFSSPNNPCRRGHIERYAHNGSCRQCGIEASSKFRKNNPEKVYKWVRRWHLSHHENIVAINNRYWNKKIANKIRQIDQKAYSDDQHPRM